MLKQITDSLKSIPVDRIPPLGKEGVDAAILIPITRESSDPKIILTKRAEHLNSHRGEVAFPGGKWEPDDEDLLVTALRETSEEIDLWPEQIKVIAGLPINRTRHLLRVKPYVGLIEPQLTLVANPEELDAVFEVPVSYFLDPANLRVDHFSGDDYSLDMPCYIFEGYRIWGFTLVVLVDFLNLTLNAGIRLHYPDRINLRPPA